MHFVTAIYNYNPSTIFGGRGYNIDFYYPVLRNTANLNIPLVLYCDPQYVDEYKQKLEPHFTAGIHVIGTPLSDFKFHDKFYPWKASFWHTIEYNNRNETLCLRKLHWLIDTINNPLFAQEDTFMWIDAGLFHHGLFPERLGGMEYLAKSEDSQYYPENLDSMFNPRLGKAIQNQVKDNLLFFCAHQEGFRENQIPLFNILKNVTGIEIPYIPYHLVGGMFGGNKDSIIKFADIYDPIVEKTIDEKIHLLEETVFSLIHAAYPDMFDLHKFEVWGHYSPGERNSLINQDGESFFKIFKRFYDSYEYTN